MFFSKRNVQMSVSKLRHFNKNFKTSQQVLTMQSYKLFVSVVIHIKKLTDANFKGILSRVLLTVKLFDFSFAKKFFSETIRFESDTEIY